MMDKIFDYILVKAAGTAIWLGVSAVASLPFHHLLVFGAVVLFCIWFIREVVTLVREVAALIRLWRD